MIDTFLSNSCVPLYYNVMRSTFIVKRNVAELEASRTHLQQSVAEAAERNKDLLATADKLRDVLKIAVRATSLQPL